MRTSFIEELDISPRQFKHFVRKELRWCPICPPHRGENATRRYKRPIKKQWQLNPKRRHHIM